MEKKVWYYTVKYGTFIYFGKKLWSHTENYGTLIDEGKTMNLCKKPMNLRFTVEHQWYYTEKIEVFKHL